MKGDVNRGQNVEVTGKKGKTFNQKRRKVIFKNDLEKYCR